MKLNFIKDKEANLEKDDLLGTKPYVSTLSAIIEERNTPLPFTIGLFGGWGTGKSSIIKTIEDKYNDDISSKTRVFVYDAWKYSKDAFRRTFILKLKEKFNLEENTDYQNFYNDKHEDIAHKNKIDGKKTFLGFLYLLPLVLFIVWLIPSANIDFQITLSIISVISTIIFYFLKDVYVQYKISVTRPKTFAPEQFENAFADAIQAITKKESIFGWFKFWDKTIHADRLVIVIDNIDRCHKELAFELLLTVKTFLEQRDKEIVFILPIDENEIKKHINKEGHDGNEFLRKLFNTTLTIKKFSEDDLFDFTKALQKKYKLEISDDVLSLISQEFSRSPRKIIQFLNVLQTEIKLAEEQEKKDSNDRSNFTEGTITNNIEFLVKVLLIKEEWTTVYEKIKDNPFLLEAINEQIDNGKEKVVYGKDSQEKDIYLTSEQRRFFESTRDIFTTNIEVFFSNRDSFPGIPDDVPKLVLSQDWKTIKTKYIEKEILNLNELLKFIDNLFNKEVAKKKSLRRSDFNIFSFIFKISEDDKYGEELLKSFYSKGKTLLNIKSKLNGNDISIIILSFNSKLLLNFVTTDLSKNNRLLQKIVNVINEKENNDENHYALLIEFINKFQDNETQLKKIGTRFSEILKESPDIFDRFKDVLQNTTAIESLIKPDLLLEFVENLEQNPDTENVEIKIKIINQYNSSKGLSTKLLKQYTNKVVSFLNSTNDLKIVNFWFANLYLLKKYFAKNDASESIFAMLNNKYQTLYNWFTSYPDDEKYKSIIKYFLDISTDLYIGDQLSQNHDSNIKNWLLNFFNRTEYKFGWQYVNNNYLKIVQKLEVMNWYFAQDIINKFNQLSEWEDKKEISETLNLMLSKTTDKKGLNESQIQTILNNYINNISTDEETVQSWLSESIKNSTIKTQLIEVIGNLSNDDKLDLLDVIKELDKNLLKDCVEEIISETGIDDLEENFEKLDNSEAGLTLINGGIEKAIKNLKYEDDGDYFKKFLGLIVEREKLPENVRVATVNKISLFLHNEKTKEEKIFALQILDKINVPKSKKTLTRELLKDLSNNDFDDEEKVLFTKVKKKK